MSYEVHPVVCVDGNDCMIADDDADADFFSLYGKDPQGFAHCIGDFTSRADADAIRSAILRS